MSIDIDPFGILLQFRNWVKSKQKKSYTFSEYKKRMEKGFKKKLSDEALEKMLTSIDNQKLTDGRTITVDDSRKRIYVGKVDEL